jgi:hypothetical protein
MQIITKISTDFNTLVEITIYGPNEIPVGHKLYGRKLSRHGTYTRSLILFNGVRVVFVIFRFCEKTDTGYITYSLLPFYISPFQRHINTFIDQVLQLFFLEHKSISSISNMLDIGLPTIRRWITKFAAAAEDIDTDTEKAMVNSKPGYRAVPYSANSIVKIVKSVFKKVFHLVKDKISLLDYGITSWINLRLKPFLGRPDNIAAYA